MREALLRFAYRNDPAVAALKDKRERRVCACRGVVVADPEDPTEGVTLHNASDRHQAWRAQR